MNIVINSLVMVIAFLHLYFLILEMFLWTTPKGLKIFNQSLEKAQLSKVLASNQGLYNGFLSAGLLWSLFHPNVEFAVELKYFFLGCVLIAGLYGGATASKKIYFIQAAPALITLVVILLRNFI